MGEARVRPRRKRDPVAELAYAQACIEGHERSIADLERVILDHRRTIGRWHVIVAKLEAEASMGGTAGLDGGLPRRREGTRSAV